MNKVYLALLTIALIPLLAACSAQPNCDDDAAQNAVIAKARDTFKRQFQQSGAPQAVVDSLKFELTGIKYTGSDGLRGARMCQAELSLTGPSMTRKMPIKYGVSKANGGAVEVTLKLGR